MNAFYQQGLKALVLLCAASFTCAGATVTLDAIDSGFYFERGTHLTTNQNYLTGVFRTEHRSFFVFDLSSVTGLINSATLRLFNPNVSPILPGYVSPDPTETLNIYDVTTSAADITGNTAGIAGFADLGSGTLYGSRVMSASDNGTVVEIGLNGSAVGDLNAAAGMFVLGGALGTLDSGDQYVFSFSMTSLVSNTTRELVLDVAAVPEPSTACLSALGTLLFVAVRQLRR